MYGVPSGVVWDPAGDGVVENDWIDAGFVVAAADIALARPARPEPPTSAGVIEEIWVAHAAGEPLVRRDSARARG